MIATDANVSRILISRQTDSYLPNDVTVQKEWGVRNWGVLGQGGKEEVVINPSFAELPQERGDPTQSSLCGKITQYQNKTIKNLAFSDSSKNEHDYGRGSREGLLVVNKEIEQKPSSLGRLKVSPSGWEKGARGQ